VSLYAVLSPGSPRSGEPASIALADPTRGADLGNASVWAPGLPLPSGPLAVECSGRPGAARLLRAMDALRPGAPVSASWPTAKWSTVPAGSGRSPASLDTLREKLQTNVFTSVFRFLGSPLYHRAVQCGSRGRAVQRLHRPGCSHGADRVDPSTGEVRPAEGPRMVLCQCGVLGCPSCRGRVAASRAKEIAARVGLALASVPYRRHRRVKFVTVTLRGGTHADGIVTAEGIRADVQRIRRAWRQLWYEASGRRTGTNVDTLAYAYRPGAGCVTKVELGSHGHVHLHALVVGVGWLPNDTKSGYWLSETWRALTGSSSQVNVQDVEVWAMRRGKLKHQGIRGAVAELSKYVSKPGHVGLSTVLAPLAAVALYKQRRWDTYGSLRGLPLDGDDRWDACPECDSHEYVQGDWAFDQRTALASLAVELAVREKITYHDTG